MTKPEIILITKIQVSRTVNVFEKNEVFNLDRPCMPVGMVLSGASWVAAYSSISESRLAVLRGIFDRMSGMRGGLRTWLFIGNLAWQDDTRIVRYRKLWEGLRARGIEIVQSGESYEHVVEAAGKLKYFGGKLISKKSSESVIKAIDEEQCAYIMILPGGIAVEELFSKGWSCESNFDEKLLEFVARHNGAVLKAVGEFDDIEAGFVAVGKWSLIKALSQ